MKAREIMTKNPRTVSPDTRLQEAATLMKSENVGLVPVVEGSGNLVGVITPGARVPATLSQLVSYRDGVPLEPGDRATPTAAPEGPSALSG